ncbi:MAG: hypothetical protein JWN73_4401 [Betaproteobacteria bacterium]|nr:hypothetical protein [Betaproteobacteria bacterium]
MGYARHAANADPRYPLLHGTANIPELKHRIEITCPGVSFNCHSYITKSRGNFCQPVTRREQPCWLEHQVFNCSASCLKH